MRTLSKLAMAGGAALALVAGSQSANAAIEYSGSDGTYGLSFDFQLPTYITTFADEACNSAMPGYSCDGVHLAAGTTSDSDDLVVFHYTVQSDPKETFDFGPGVLDHAGTYTSGNATLTVTDLNAGVPEPASWALLISGFSLVGATMRKRRASLRHA